MIAAVVLFALPLSAGAAASDDGLPGLPASADFTDNLQFGVDDYDIFRVYLRAGQRVRVTMTEVNDPGSDFDIRLYPPDVVHLGAGWLTGAGGPANPQELQWDITQEGWHYINVSCASGAGDYRLEIRNSYPLGVTPGPATPERVWGSDRYTTAVEIAKKAFPGWQRCEHVILASGEDRAAADPLAAAGLSWTYGGPILLTQEGRVPSAVIQAIRGIAAANGNVVTVHVVGGPVSVPEERLTEITTQVPGTVTYDRVLATGDRFDLAAAIAARMSSERPTGQMDLAGFGDIALIANGADPDKFFDALALSAIAARSGYPILLVNQDSVPSATKNALSGQGFDTRIIGGGPATVSEGVKTQLEAGSPVAYRWAGDDRYQTAAIIAGNAVATSPGMLKEWEVGVAAKLPDALAGGAGIGLRGSPVIITPGDRLDSATRLYLRSYGQWIDECYVLGGSASVTESTKNEIGSAMVP